MTGSGSPDPRGRVLVVSFRFPPHGGGGVHRVAHFVHNLPRFGWEPHVLTGPWDGRRHIHDLTLLELVEDVQVTRSRYRDLDRFYRALGRLHLASVAKACTPWLPNLQAGWIPYAIREGRRLLEEESFDLIFSSSYPICSHLVACRLSRSAGLPWVADYRDEWSIRNVINWPTPLHRRLARWIDGRIMRAADRVVTTSPAHTRRFADTFGGERSKWLTIPNGYDPSDFPASAEESGGLEDGEGPPIFTVAYVGTLFRRRRPDAFLQAVRDVIAEGWIEPDHIEVQFVGYTHDIGHEDLQRTGVIRTTGYVTHDEAVRRMRQATLLLLVNTERTNIPTKTFEYLASGRPILAAVREGPTADLVRDKNAGLVVPPDDRGAMGRVLRDAIRSWKEGTMPRGARRQDIRDLSRPALTRRLTQVFEVLTGAAAASPPPSATVFGRPSETESLCP